MKKNVNQVSLLNLLSFGDLADRNPVQFIKNIYVHFYNDSLYRNSIYLMLSTAIMSVLGFFFWILNARIYTPEQVGIATTLISVMSLISSFSGLGLNVGLIRFLPMSDKKNEKINSSLILTILASILISIIFLIGLPYFSPTLTFLRKSLFYIVTFIIFVAAVSANSLIESIFIAYRSAKYAFLKNSILSVTKLVLPIFLIAFRAYGIFAAVGIANICALLVSIGLLIFNLKYKIKFTFDIDVIKKIGSYSFGNYIAGFLGSLPNLILPIFVANNLGTKEAGYFYISLMIASFLFIIPQATTQSLFAEGSYSEDEMNGHILKATKITILLLIPATLLIVFFGNHILLAFGKSYSMEAFNLLKLMAISSIFISINYILATILRVKNQIKELIIIGAISAFIIILLSYIFINMQLFGIGLAWLVGQILISIVHFYYVLKRN